MTVVLVGHQIHVVVVSSVFDGVNRLLNSYVTIFFLVWLFEVRGPRVILDAFRDWFSVVIVVVAASCN